MNSEDNMRIWGQVCYTDPDMTEKINFGAFKFTTIDAMYQVQNITKMFGPCGEGWGIKDSKFDKLVVDPNDKNYDLLVFTAKLWYKMDGKINETDIAADIELFESTKNGWKRVSDPVKKVRTDALTKAISWLGFNADVFLGKFDNNKYVEKLRVLKENDKLPQIKGADSTVKKQSKSSSKEKQPAKPADDDAQDAQEEPQEAAVTEYATATTKAPTDVKEKVETTKFKSKVSPEIQKASDESKKVWASIQDVIDVAAHLDDKKQIQSELNAMTKEVFGLPFFPEVPGDDVSIDNYRNAYPYLTAFKYTLASALRLRRIQKSEEQAVLVHKHLGVEFSGKITLNTLNEASKMVVAHDKMNFMKALAKELSEINKSS